MLRPAEITLYGLPKDTQADKALLTQLQDSFGNVSRLPIVDPARVVKYILPRRTSPCSAG